MSIYSFMHLFCQKYYLLFKQARTPPISFIGCEIWKHNYRMHVFYIFNKNVKFRLNHMLFTIWSKTYFLCIILDHKNWKFIYLIDDISNNLWSSWNFASIGDIIRTCNPIARYSKFTTNKKIYEKFEEKLFLIISCYYNFKCFYFLFNLIPLFVLYFKSII